jgi:hypothetical protein
VTTPLTSEPVPGDGQVPFMSQITQLIWQRLPEVYATMDARDLTWTFKRYLAATTDPGGAVSDTYIGIDGDRPVGPATPIPWGMIDQELANWQAARISRLSSLGDPMQADSTWLPWLAQLVGARLDPAASDAEQRDTIAFATSGWRAGTTSAIEDAARSALTGSRFAKCLQATAGDTAGGPWDLTVVTRASETPDPGAVIDAILRKGVKPAGAVLHTRSYEASWATLAATRPTWLDWRLAGTWQRIEESGLSYASVPDNLMVNPSFETGTTGWSALHSAAFTSIEGGVDGVFEANLVASVTGAGVVAAAVIPGILASRDYLYGFSLLSTVALTNVVLTVAWTNAAHASLGSTTITIPSVAANTWTRVSGQHLAPVAAANALPSIDVGTLASGSVVNLDAGLFRLIT